GAVTLIDRIRDFLIQPVRERTDFTETIDQLIGITRTWNELLTSQSQ
ncbi:hypothetical protein KY329_05620, partial [Candidatus Woesearchaeota archaeon]|nr:hypothetical protein [Candidatus Woesearchaeota archaeon]